MRVSHPLHYRKRNVTAAYPLWGKGALSGVQRDRKFHIRLSPPHYNRLCSQKKREEIMERRIITRRIINKRTDPPNQPLWEEKRMS